MVQIELTTKQLEELKNHYILELEKLHQRSTEIMGLLSKLAKEPISSVPEAKADLKPAGDKTEVKIKHRGRPTSTPNLSDFILQVLKEKNKPLTREQIIKAYNKEYKIDLSGTTASMASLNQTLFRLRAKQNLITSTRRKGKRGNLYSIGDHAEEAVVKTRKKREKKEVTAESTLPVDTKHNWPQFITDTLYKAKRVLCLKDFLNYAMVQFSIPSHEKKATYGRISPVLTQMSKAKNKIRTYKKEGTARKYYALNEWFTEENELEPLYK